MIVLAGGRGGAPVIHLLGRIWRAGPARAANPPPILIHLDPSSRRPVGRAGGQEDYTTPPDRAIKHSIESRIFTTISSVIVGVSIQCMGTARFFFFRAKTFL